MQWHRLTWCCWWSMPASACAADKDAADLVSGRKTLLVLNKNDLTALRLQRAITGSAASLSQL